MRDEERFKPPKRINDVLDSVVRSLGMTKSYNGWQVVSRWDEVVGEQIAEHAHAIRFEDGTLFVAVVDDAWRQELSMQVDQILAKIKNYPFGSVVKRLRLIKGEKG